MKDHIYKVGSSLHRLGFRKGDTIAIYSPNHLHYATMLHAAAILGGTITTINPAYTDTEVQHHIKDSGTSFVSFIKYLVLIPEIRCEVLCYPPRIITPFGTAASYSRYSESHRAYP